MKSQFLLIFLIFFVSFSSDSKKLLEYEKNTISVFEDVNSSVAFITNKALKRDFYSLDIFEIPQGTGSGFIWDQDGHIVTNYHVIENANKLTVTLYDNSSYDAELVGIEPNKDIAVLKIKAPKEKLKSITLGNIDDLKVGRIVMAIGNPFGLDFTLTTGIISALGREIESGTGRKIHNVIQTDASINPGNSGGPLLNSSGELIGINTAIYSTSGSSAGIGFAIPINTVKEIVPQLIKFGKVIRPGLGVVVLDDSYAKRMGIEGVIIHKVEKNSSAFQAGLKGLSRDIFGRYVLGDIIIGINGISIDSGEKLSEILEKFKVGDTVEVIILRDDNHYRLNMKLQSVN
ncbi:MAG: trypsin-like peptidase domain-containing protein [Candidatus Delongbacteria bacterium]|nr:trypsin-like peptidase domain-containing protein [Candidatus Delongbacteria bacterium]MBN2835667.1 trypsin-like peptidase domain-containing protein [Candidatus Delongbacteria bacterium]